MPDNASCDCKAVSRSFPYGFHSPSRQYNIDLCLSKRDNTKRTVRVDERSMQYTAAVLEVANGLQFRQWSSRGKEMIIFHQRSKRWSPARCPDGMALASPSLSLSPARFEVSERGEVAREGNIFSRCSDDYSHLHPSVVSLVRLPSLALTATSRFRSFRSRLFISAFAPIQRVHQAKQGLCLLPTPP